MKYKWFCPTCNETRLLVTNPKYYGNNERICRPCSGTGNPGKRGPAKQDSKWRKNAVRTTTEVAELVDMTKMGIAAIEKRSMNKILSVITKEMDHPTVKVGNRSCPIRKALQHYLMEYYVEEYDDGLRPTDAHTVESVVNTFKNTKRTRTKIK